MTRTFIKGNDDSLFTQTYEVAGYKSLTASLRYGIHKPYQRFSQAYRGAGKSSARPGRKYAPKDVKDARDFNNMETRAVIKIFFFCKARRRRKFTPF